jgi:hypothetical protein
MYVDRLDTTRIRSAGVLGRVGIHSQSMNAHVVLVAVLPRQNLPIESPAPGYRSKIRMGWALGLRYCSPATGTVDQLGAQI